MSESEVGGSPELCISEFLQAPFNATFTALERCEFARLNC